MPATPATTAHTAPTITRQTACRHTFRTIHPPARHPAGTRLAAGLPVPPAFAFLPQRNRPVRHANRIGNPLTPPSDPSGLIPPQKCTNVSSVTNRNKNSALPMNAPSSPYTLLNHEKRPSTPAVAGVFLCAAQRSPTPRHPPATNAQTLSPRLMTTASGYSFWPQLLAMVSGYGFWLWLGEPIVPPRPHEPCPADTTKIPIPPETR